MPRSGHRLTQLALEDLGGLATRTAAYWVRERCPAFTDWVVRCLADVPSSNTPARPTRRDRRAGQWRQPFLPPPRAAAAWAKILTALTFSVSWVFWITCDHSCFRDNRSLVSSSRLFTGIQS